MNVWDARQRTRIIHMTGSPEFPRLILASASARRASLLSCAGLRAYIRTSDIAEDLIWASKVTETASARAAAKANCVRLDERSYVVLGADTVVDCDGQLLGKPTNAEAARSMLDAASGRDLAVSSAVVLQHLDRRVLLSEGRSVVTSQVRMKPYDSRVIECYLASDEWRGKAGALAIQGQGRQLVQLVKGCLTNVVGLPICVVLAKLHDLLGMTSAEKLNSEEVCETVAGKICGCTIKHSSFDLSLTNRT
jgi:MAF protein